MRIDRRGLAGVLTMSFAFGSLHAFASILEPLQTYLRASRGEVSLGYSIAIVALTVGVFLGARLSQRMTDRWLCAICGLGAAVGLAVAALWAALPVFWLSYGLTFGACNGIAYGLFIARAGQSWPARSGLSVGLATATYGMGAGVFGLLLGYVAQAASTGMALLVMSTAVFGAGVMAAVLFGPEPRQFRPAALPASPPRLPPAIIARIWLAYLLAACGGLMVIAHSESILAWLRVPQEISALSVSFNASGNVLGSILGGLLADRFRPKTALALPVLLSMTALLLMGTTGNGPLLLLLLTAAGAAYGSLIAVVPAMLRHLVGASEFRRLFPLIFSAWGIAGGVGPALAGFLYDWQAGYGLAVLLAAAMAGGALVIILAGRIVTPQPAVI